MVSSKIDGMSALFNYTYLIGNILSKVKVKKNSTSLFGKGDLGGKPI